MNFAPSTYDFVVLGTGAAGLIAALSAADHGASVLVLEKGDKIGGSTALSSGVAWIPANKYAAAAGFPDSQEMALDYLASLSHDLVRPEMAEAFVHSGPEMIDWLEDRTPLRLKLVPGFPDYHPEHPGGKPEGGRSVEPELFSFGELGEWADRVVGHPRHMLITETAIGGGTGFLEDDVDQKRRTEKIEGLGRAMVGALLKGCLDKGVGVRTHTRATDLVLEDGKVRGVICETVAGTETINARGGVIIATGGFERDTDLVKAFLRGPVEHLTGVPTNTGDGLRMSMRIGAMLGAMREAWWVPVVAIPDETHPEGKRGHLVEFERTMPRSIMVNRYGVRFTNEAASDNDLGGPFHHLDTHFNWVNNPCWLIFDQEYVTQYGGFGIPAGREMPGWVTRADSIEALASELDIPAAAFQETVAKWNAAVQGGRDEEFGRGDSAHDVWFGDRTHYPTRQATLGPIDQGPYYAVQVHISTLGTTGGPQTTANCEVIDVHGDVIPGLWAAGNAMASPTRMIYGGAGGSLGPALVFGYRAGRHAASTRASTAATTEQEHR
ncbi:FAD-dependent oxidoreductase [Arthrobacter nitrophenolicus]|uniref:Succinate dehydrogenase/fumarate reductase flavoprotein subunit n=2 Tax=Arthrobacter nitrophenolicus TaxID=683150 RepID=A0ACC6TKX0_9MICC|nr:FAD-dependent oxidoreductase [Arthrobacter nitrophenolicus]ELT42849.1 fumarate reductase/succinate dehydrogenase flavoprotein domain-containing protein [Arthrobacter nitrophenolicus]